MLKKFILLFFLSLSFSCVTTHANNILLEKKDRPSKENIKSFLDNYFEKEKYLNENATLLVAVTENKKTIIFRYGKADELDKYYAIGSLSKSLTSALVAKLVFEKKLSYSEKIGNVTLFELLTHKAGIKDFIFTLDSFMDIIDFSFTGNDVFNRIDKKRLEKELKSTHPDESDYSSLGYALVQQHLEKKFNIPFSKLMEPMLKNLKMFNTVFSPEQKTIASGYPYENPQFRSRTSALPLSSATINPLMLASTGYWSKIEDLVIFIEKIKSNESYFKDLNYKLSPDYNIKTVSTAVNFEKIEGKEISYKRGLGFGHSSYIGYSKDVSVAIIRNSIKMTDDLGHNLLLGLSE